MSDNDFIHKRSLLEGCGMEIIVFGDASLVQDIIITSRDSIEKNIDLYTAQERIKDNLIFLHGKEWYEKSAEAINFLIENEYCTAEREKQPFFDSRTYEKQINSCAMYD